MEKDDLRNGPRITRRRLLLGTAGSALVTGLAGCQGDGDGTTTEVTTTEPSADDDDDTPMDGETTTSADDTGNGGGALPTGKLQFAQAKAPIKFDPITLNDVPSAEIAQLVFDPLYTYKAGTSIDPAIAASMPEVRQGAQRWIVELNSEATFQNGDPVTAEDVKYSFLAPVQDQTENAGEVNMIDTIEVVDEETVQFDLKFPYGAFRHVLAWSIVPKSVREANVTRADDGTIASSEFETNPVGAGPFQFADWREGEFVRLERWDDYWGDPVPNLSEVEFVPVEEGTTRITTLRTGENDVIKTIPPKSWPTVRNMNEAGIESVPGISYFYLAFNCRNGPTADPEVREAIDYAFSMDNAVERFVEPSGVRQYSPIPRAVGENWGLPLDDWAEIPHERDVDKAKSMLDDNDNVPSNWRAKIIVPPDDKREQIGVSVANGLKEAGYRAQVQRFDWGTFLEKYITGDTSDYNMYTLGWSGVPDPDSFMYFLFAQEQFEVTNGSFYENDAVDEMIMNARESNDREQRTQWYTDAITTILEDRAHLPSYGLKNSFGVRSHIEDFAAHPVDQFHAVSSHNNVAVQ